MEYFMDMKDLLCVELEEYEEQMKMKGKVAAGDLEAVHKITDIIKNILKINLLGDEVEEMSGGSSYEGGSSYARGGGRGRGRNARRDSMGRYASYEGGYSEEGGSYRRGGSSYEGGQGGHVMGGQGGNMGGGSSYARGGRGGNQGGGNRGGGRGGYSREGGYSRDGAKEYMMEQLEEWIDEAENPKQKEALHKCMQALERA